MPKSYISKFVYIYFFCKYFKFNNISNSFMWSKLYFMLLYFFLSKNICIGSVSLVCEKSQIWNQIHKFWTFLKTKPTQINTRSVSLLQGVCYLLLPEFCPDHPSVGICGASYFWRTSIISLAKLKSLLGLSNAYTRRYDACGSGGTYSTWFCLFFLLEC